MVGAEEVRPVPELDSPPERVYFRDIKPYEMPARLDDLSGPAGGVIELPHSVLWAPGGSCVDLDVPGGTMMAYQAVIGEGTVADQIRVLHRGRLMQVWVELMLPRRARALWEAQFPELRTIAVA